MNVVAVTHWVKPVDDEADLLALVVAAEPGVELGQLRGGLPAVVARSVDSAPLQRIEAVLRDRGHGAVVCAEAELAPQTQWTVAVVRWSRPVAEEIELLAPVFSLLVPDLRLRAQSALPALLARRLDPRTAQAWCAVLRDRGHGAVASDLGTALLAATLPVVRRFELAADALCADDDSGASWRIPWSAIGALIRAPSLVELTESLAVHKSKNIGLRSEIKRASAPTGEQLYLIGTPPAPSLLLQENRLQYQGLGALAMRTRRENFVTLVDQLRQRASSAWFDQTLVAAPLPRETRAPLSNRQPTAIDAAVHVLWQAQRERQL